MGTYVYCVVPTQHAPAIGFTGVDGIAVTSYERGGVDCWIAELPRRPAPSVDRIREHHAVIERAVSEAVTPVPFRFGQWLDSLEELAAHLSERHDHYRNLLDSFAGKLEFGLRVIEPGRMVDGLASDQHTAVPTGSAERVSGRAYLEELGARMRAAATDTPQVAALRSHLHDTFADLARLELVEPLPTTHGVLSVAHLVARSDFASYHERIGALERRWPELRFLASGPWPPYSFAA